MVAEVISMQAATVENDVIDKVCARARGCAHGREDVRTREGRAKVPYMSNTDNLYPIDKSTFTDGTFLSIVQLVFTLGQFLRMGKCLAMQEVRNTIFIALVSRWFPS